MTCYLLDANVLIEAKRRYYAFDLCPGFWDCLLAHQQAGRLQSIDRVRDELDKGEDELTAWVKTAMPAACFAATYETDVLNAFAQIQIWAMGQDQYLPEAKAQFANVADAWLVAYAKARDCVLVTQEQPSKESRRRILIPNVCDAFGVRYVDTFAMLKDLDVLFNWDQDYSES